MPRLVIAPDPLAAATAAATLLADALDTGSHSGQPVHVALAGGTTPRAAYERLAQVREDWAGVHLWFGDERIVPLDSPDANASMVRAALIDIAEVPTDQVHVVPTWLGGDGARDAYADEIHHWLPVDGAGTPVFDIAVLGLGEDAHIASLFPGSVGLSSRGAVCILESRAPKPPAERISLSLQTFAAARLRIVLVTGVAKAGAVVAALEAGPTPAAPASLLPRDGTTWVMDHAAASALDLGDDRA